MARSFTAASEQYLQIEQAVVSAAPCTIAMWALSTSVNDVLFIIDDGSLSHRIEIYRKSGGATEIMGYVAGTGGNDVIIGPAMTSSVWYHVCLVLGSTTSRTIYLDGNKASGSATSITPSGLNRTRISGLSWASGYEWDGKVAEAAIWDVALTDAEVASLAAKFAPPCVRPQNIVAYWPMVRPLEIGGAA